MILGATKTVDAELQLERRLLVGRKSVDVVGVL